MTSYKPYEWLPDSDADVGNPRDYGGADYIHALRETSAAHSAGIPGTPSLPERRESILRWLQNKGTGPRGGAQWLSPNNQPGQGGLYDRIEGHGSPNRDINADWGDWTDPDTAKMFTHDDWLATQAMSFSQWQIKDWLRTPEGRAKLLPKDKPGVVGGVYENIIQSIRGDYARGHMGGKKFPTKYGVDTKAFDDADYIEALRASPNPQRARKDILSWIEASPEWLRYEDRPKEFRPEYDQTKPETYGLYERIKGEYHNRDINTFWGNWKRGSYSGDAGRFFTHDDLLATRAMGFKEKQISGWLDTNPDVLLNEDKPGVAGGVYESIERGLKANLTRDKFNQYTQEFQTTSRPTVNNLKFNPGKAFAPRRASGIQRAKDLGPQGLKKRKKLRQTTDLQRSLNIS